MIKITATEFNEWVEDYSGICLSCHTVQFGGVEPDAEEYECEDCGEHQVMGAEQALICGEIEVVEDV